MHFSIITPVLNGEKFLDQTILSVVGQAGPFTIRYHVQDGGSKDATLDMLTAWQGRLARDFPVFCEGIEFTFSSAPDRGLLRRGRSRLWSLWRFGCDGVDQRRRPF